MALNTSTTLLSDESIARTMRPYVHSLFSEVNSKWQARLELELKKQREEFDAHQRETRWAEFLQACTTRSQAVEQAVRRAETAEARVRQLERELQVTKERAAKALLEATTQSLGKTAILKALEEREEEARDADDEDEDDATKVHSPSDTKFHSYRRKTLIFPSESTPRHPTSSSRFSKPTKRSHSCPRPIIPQHKTLSPPAAAPSHSQRPHGPLSDDPDSDFSTPKPSYRIPSMGFAFPKHRLSLSQSTNDTTVSRPTSYVHTEPEAALRDALRNLSKYKRTISISSVSPVVKV